MQHVLALSHSFLLAKYKVRMCAMVPVVCPPWGLMVIRDNSLGLLPTRNPHGFVAVRYRGCPGRGDILDMTCCPFSFIFNLDGG